jgi:DNA-binding NtrC family response regulator
MGESSDPLDFKEDNDVAMQIQNGEYLKDDARSWNWNELESQPGQMIKEKLVGISEWAEDARSAIAAHASHDNPLVIEGEPGTGKKLVARLIHKSSARAQGPFVTISCHHVSPESIEAALFGSSRTLSPGREYLQSGLVESAEGGTLYICGVFGFTHSLQSKIARLIYDRKFVRVGGEAFEPANARIILGFTRSGQASEIAADRAENFIGDKLVIPALRERAADIDPLSRYFIKQLCQQLGKEEREISPETLALLIRHDWPGNVGELKRVISYMLQQQKPPRMDNSFLPPHLQEPAGAVCAPDPAAGLDMHEQVKEFEISLLCAALKQCQGVQYKAARLLGLKPTTLNTKIKNLGIDVKALK